MSEQSVQTPLDDGDVALGKHLRNIRRQQGLTLHDVEKRSSGQLNASVVGSYERGERNVSVSRLQQLASFYRVPVTHLLPNEQPRTDDGPVPGQVTVDLEALEHASNHEPALANYVESVQTRRGDFNGRVITLRASDLELLAATQKENLGEMHSRMVAAGILR